MLYVNRGNMLGIEGFDQAESDALLDYLNNLYERSLDIQLRWHWTPGTSAIWDNRATIHSVSFDYDEVRHVSGVWGRGKCRLTSRARASLRSRRSRTLTPRPRAAPRRSASKGS